MALSVKSFTTEKKIQKRFDYELKTHHHGLPMNHIHGGSFRLHVKGQYNSSAGSLDQIIQLRELLRLNDILPLKEDEAEIEFVPRNPLAVIYTIGYFDVSNLTFNIFCHTSDDDVYTWRRVFETHLGIPYRSGEKTGHDYWSHAPPPPSFAETRNFAFNGGSFHLMVENRIHSDWGSLDEIIRLRDILQRGTIEFSYDLKAPCCGAFMFGDMVVSMFGFEMQSMLDFSATLSRF